MAKASSKRKGSQKVPARARDTPDPSLVISGRRIRKPTERAQSAENIVINKQAKEKSLSDIPEDSEPEDREPVGITNQKADSDFVPAATPSPEESESDNKASTDISSDSEPVKTKVTKAKPMSKLSIKKVLKAPVTRECIVFSICPICTNCD
jgi:hypothetical protein